MLSFIACQIWISLIFWFPKIWQNIFITPAGISERFPLIEITFIAPNIQHCIQNWWAAKYLATGPTTTIIIHRLTCCFLWLWSKYILTIDFNHNISINSTTTSTVLCHHKQRLQTKPFCNMTKKLVSTNRIPQTKFRLVLQCENEEVKQHKMYKRQVDKHLICLELIKFRHPTQCIWSTDREEERKKMEKCWFLYD